MQTTSDSSDSADARRARTRGNPTDHAADDGGRERVALGPWAAWMSLACLFLAMLDLALATIAAPLVASTMSGALQTWSLTVGTLATHGFPLAAILAFADRRRVRAALPRSPTLIVALAIGVCATFALAVLDERLVSATQEFTEPLRARWVASVVLIGGLVVATPFATRLIGHLVRRGEHLATTCLLLLGCTTSMYVAYFSLLPVFAVDLAGVALIGALVCLALAIRRIVPAPPTRTTRGLVAFIVLLGVIGTGAPWQREHARYVLMNHSATADLAERVRDIVDRDGDGSASRWFGGTDCDEGDARRGPLLREVPGDGIDQDCRGGDASPPAAPPKATLPDGCSPAGAPMSVVFMLVDALRADAVTPEVMPIMSTMARDSWVFERAYSPTAMTFTSVPAMFGARAASDVGAANPLMDGTLTLPFTLAERFREGGYRTIAFSDYFFTGLFGRGFSQLNPEWHDARRDVKGTLSAASRARGIAEALTSSEQQAFIWAHFSDTHARYKLDRGSDGRRFGDREAYLRGAAYVDHHLGQLLREIEAGGYSHRTIVVVSADHGEELLAHGRQGHGASVYEESVHVPLLMRIPGCPPRRFAGPVSNRAVGPTLGALTGIDIPGRGLFDSDGPVVVEAPTGLYTHYNRAVIGARHKLVIDVPNGGAMLFDLERDPAETTAITDPAARAELEVAYQRWLDSPGSR